MSEPGTPAALLWENGVLGYKVLSGFTYPPTPEPSILPTHQPSCMGTLVSSSRW